MKQRIISLSFKWALTAMLLVIIVIAVYAGLMISLLQNNVDRQTERLTRVHEASLDEIGTAATSALGLPASSLMLDNDRRGLFGLLLPLVRATDFQAEFVALISAEGRIWAVAAASSVEKIKLRGELEIYERTSDDFEPKMPDSTGQEHLRLLTRGVTFPSHTNVVHEIVRNGKSEQSQMRQFVSEVVDRQGNKQGYMILGYSLAKLEEEKSAILSEGNEQREKAGRLLVFSAVGVILLGIFIALLQSLGVTRNIKALTRDALRISQGDLSVRSQIKTRDEVGLLGKQFNEMADKVAHLLEETQNKAMLEKELDIARQIQTTLLPTTGYARCGKVELSGYFEPASACGGDFWQYSLLPDGSTLLIMGDVTGHGVPSAMITASAKSCLDTLLHLGNNLSIVDMMGELNKTIFESAKRSLFMTFIILRVDVQKRTLEVVNAGHHFPIVLSKGEVKAIVNRGNRLGDQIDARYESTVTALDSGDRILLYTDGITECSNAQGGEYGERRLRNLFRNSENMRIDETMSYILSDLEKFKGEKMQEDDITLLIAGIVK